jgi:hypothetical protein
MGEFLYMRPLMAGKFTYTELRNGTINLTDLLKINALMDFEAALNKPDKVSQ